MEALERQLTWIFGYRVVTLGAVAFLLPPMVPLAWPQLPWLAGVAVMLLVFWSAPLWREPGRVTAPAIGLALEGLLYAGLSFGFGGATSPIMLLAIPTLAHAAIALPTGPYAAVAGLLLAGYAVVLGRELDPASLPAWVPLWVAALVLTVVWLGVAGAILRQQRDRAHLEARQFQRYRRLVEAVPAIAPTPAADRAFWRSFLAQAVAAGEFTSGAIVRWDGPHGEVMATDREASWNALVRRHTAAFRAATPARGPQVFVEERAAEAGQARAIICWPIPHRTAGVAGALCMLGPAPVDLEQASRHVARYLPLAALALALGEPALALHRQPVDWRVIINATLHRLHGRLARYLVLVHVDPGRVEADPLLLADAIAHVIEEVLDRIPPQTPVRLAVHHTADGWRFQVETEHPPADRPGGPRPGLVLARQVVTAHGGAWEQVEESGMAYRVGFVIPAPTGSEERPASA